jgi:hypothetical protein
VMRETQQRLELKKRQYEERLKLRENRSPGVGG